MSRHVTFFLYDSTQWSTKFRYSAGTYESDATALTGAEAGEVEGEEGGEEAFAADTAVVLVGEGDCVNQERQIS